MREDRSLPGTDATEDPQADSCILGRRGNSLTVASEPQRPDWPAMVPELGSRITSKDRPRLPRSKGPVLAGAGYEYTVGRNGKCAVRSPSASQDGNLSE